VEIVKAVQDEINHPDSYYTSMADFVKEALREKLERLRATCVKPKRTS
jgi:Arc/MetJ-type ribon-helix-helix transcriptional regulator